MKNLLLSATISAGLLTAVVILMFCGTSPSGEAAARQDHRLAEAPRPSSRQTRPLSPAPGPEKTSGPAGTAVAEVPDDHGALDMVHLTSASVLAKVNDSEITLKDLLAIGEAEDGEAALSLEMYRSLLSQAIERELILQAARAKGLDLTEDQQRQKEKVRDSVLASEDGPGVQLNRLGTVEDQVDFEMRDAECQLFLNSLLAQEGASPDVTEDQVRKYYQEHAGEYAAEHGANPREDPTAWQKIDLDIRQQLAPAASEAYQASRQGFLDRLRAGAEINILKGQ